MPANILALHTWTLDTTSLAQVLSLARSTGWQAVELRRVDFLRARKAGLDDAAVVAAVRDSGLPVACLGVQMGWLFCPDDAYRELRTLFVESCGVARALGCTRLMSASDRGSGPAALAVARIREFAAIAADSGLLLSLEFNSGVEQVNALAVARDLVSAAAHPGCRLLLDTYHLQRTGATPGDVAALAASEIGYVQFSDVPHDGPRAEYGVDRLPPGQGCVPFREMFAAILGTGYTGPLSYEAPNPRAWERSPADVLVEALAATRRVLPPLVSSSR